MVANDTSRGIEHLLLCREIEEFLYHEADLLDARRFEEWLDLFSEDVRYFMPMLRNVRFGEQEEREETREQQDISWFDEGKVTLTHRVQQIQSGIHWAEEPLSRTSHMVTNVELLKESPEEVTVKSRFLIYRNRVETETDFFVGKREDVIRRENGAWKIVHRKITLDQNVLLAKNLTILF